MNQIIQSLMNFLSPDTRIAPNPIVNACAFGIVGIAIVTFIARLFIKVIIIEKDLQISLKQKLINYTVFILGSIMLVLLFFPLYNIIRTVLNPELIKSLLDNP
jgi:uncharacterized membrane protein YjjP (DUF1212 family)